MKIKKKKLNNKRTKRKKIIKRRRIRFSHLWRSIVLNQNKDEEEDNEASVKTLSLH